MCTAAQALFTYWVTSSVFSLSQLLLLRIPGLKARLGIPDLRVIPKSTAPRQGGGAPMGACTSAQALAHKYTHTHARVLGDVQGDGRGGAQEC
jgi:hypothetical protein